MARAGGEGHGVLLGDADVEVALRQRLLQLVERGALGHRGGDADDGRITLRQLDQRIAEDVLILRRLAGLLLHLAGHGIVRAGAVELGRLALGEVAAAALLGDHLDQDRAVHLARLVEDLDQLLDVVAVEGAQEGEAELLEDHAALAGQQELLGAAHGAAGHLSGQRAAWHVVQRVADQLAQPPVALIGAHLAEVGVERADVVGDALVVVVEDDDEVFLQRAGVVDRFQRHAAGERAVANDRDDLVVLAAQVARGGHAEGGGDRGAGVAGAEDVVLALVPAQIAGDALKLLDGAEAVAPAGDELVRICLVADVPDELVMRRIEGDVQRQRQLDGTQVRRQMSAAQCDRLDDLLAHLLRELSQFRLRERS